MSEKKFKAWDNAEKKMVEDFILNSKGELMVIMYGEIVATYRKDCFELIQYTGLKDKNGVEIFEGDILKVFVEGELSPVTPDGKDFISSVEFKWGAYALPIKKFDDYVLLGSYLDKTEVIGNIYENPELLESISHE